MTADSTGDPTTTPAPATPTTPESTSTTQGSASSGWQRANLGFVSAYILYRNGEAALIDTGVRGSEDAISAALGQVDLEWDSVGHVIVTHKHPDHQGSLEGVMLRTDDAPWYAEEGHMAAIESPNDGLIVGDGDSVFDLKIIETPGHTPGHLSVLDPATGVLVTGDALNGAGGGVIGANEQFSEDMVLANASIQKLAGFDFDVALFGHGEPITSAAGAAIRELASGL